MINKMFLLSFFEKYKLVLLISLFLFIAPFFWLKPGEMDLGGDSNRLYFYDPVSYIKYTSIYDVLTVGRGSVEPNYYYLPLVALLAFLKLITFSPTTIISLFNGIKLGGGFVAIYLIVHELLLQKNEASNRKNMYIAAILAGLFYVVSFGSVYMAIFWDRAITSHNQIFLNPIIFYLFLKFLLTNKYKYLWVTLLVSFFFAPNFALTSAPPFFAFYPLAFLFLFLNTKIFGKKPISWKGVCIGLVLFLGIHAFHLLGQVINLFDSGSLVNSRVFNKEQIEQGGVNYFAAVSGFGKASLNLLLPPATQSLRWTSLLAPFIVIVGFLLNRMSKKFLLVSLFFILTLFLTTANITDIGFELYKRLFYIPGFSMFRNFYTQWQFIFIFFYSLLFGFAMFFILEKLKSYYKKLFIVFVFVVLLIISVPLISGELVTKSIIRGSNNVKSTFIMDAQYEKTFQFIRSLPNDGKILVLPLTDYYLQVINGKNGGAYEGPSTLTHLAGKYSFVGYQHFGYEGNTPYAEDIMKYAREKNYERLLNIFTTLNIRYILHNSDPMVYEKGFSPGPYGYMQTSLPKTQDEYKKFLAHFPLRTIYANDAYSIYEIDKSAYNSTIFIPDGVYQSSQLSFDQDKAHAIFINENICSKKELGSLCTGYKKPNIDISFNMINPTLYAVTVRARKKIDSLLLVMQHTFHNGWKVVVDGKYIAEDLHFPVNGYANGWLLAKKDLPDKQNYTLFIQLDPQKFFWYGSFITGISLITVVGLLIYSLTYTRNKT